MITTKALFGGDASLDDRSLGFLADAIEKNNLPGFDYFEFKRSVAALTSMALDEGVAHKSAFATAATVGLTKDKLVETAKYYRDVLGKEKVSFDAALQAQEEARVQAKVSEITRLKDQVARHKETIQRLEDEMGAYLNQIESAEKSIEIERSKLDRAVSSFDSTLQAVYLTIDRDIENIHKYL